MAKVVGVHGIAQQFTSGPELTRGWVDALRGGLEAAGHRAVADRLADTDVRVAFFGDLFRPVGAMSAQPPPFTPRDIRPGPETELLRSLYDEAVNVEPMLGPPSGSMGPGQVVVQVMLEQLLRSKSLARVAQRRFVGDLKQVNQFLFAAAAKDEALSRVDAEVDESTRVLVGHSLGSVVAYEYLCHYRPQSVELFVTVGSPLGIPHVVFDHLTPSPVEGLGAWPGQVTRWVNVADADDIVALRKTLGPLFSHPDGGPALMDELVDNGKEPHAVERYLNSKPVGEALASARKPRS